MKFIKDNSIALILFLLLVLLATYFFAACKIRTYYENMIVNPTTENACAVILKYEKNELCTKMLENSGKTIDTLTVFSQVNAEKGLGIYYSIAPLIIILAGIYQINKEFRSLHVKNYVTRNQYKEYIKKVLLNSYKNAWILPAFALYMFLWSYYISGHFNYSYTELMGFSTFPVQFLKIPFLFMFLFMLNMFFISIFYISIGLLVVKHNKSVITSTIEGGLIFYGLAIINTFIMEAQIYPKLFKISNVGNLDFLDIYTYSDKTSLLAFTLFCFCLSALSVILVKLSYKNKEKNIILLEKISG